MLSTNKMKSHLVKNTAGTHLNHSQVSLSLKTPIKIVKHMLTTRESSCGFGHVQIFYRGGFRGAHQARDPPIFT